MISLEEFRESYINEDINAEAILINPCINQLLSIHSNREIGNIDANDLLD